MKKTIVLLLTFSLLLALAGCADAPAASGVTPAPERAGTDASSTAAPDPGTAAPEGTPVPEETAERQVVVSFRIEKENVTADDGQTLLLEFSAAGASVDIQGDPETSARINRALDDQFREITSDRESEVEGVLTRADLLEGAKRDLAYRTEEGQADSFAPYYLRRAAEVRRADGRVLSLEYMDSSYAGGAHGYTAHSGRNYDLRTGKELSLTDLAEDGDAFLRAAADRLLEVCHGPEYAMVGFFDDPVEDLSSLLRDNNWYFDGSGLTVIANAYEIAPYAAGTITFTLPYAWLEWNIRPEYMPVPADGAGELAGAWADSAEGGTFVYDDGTDGQGGRVRFTAAGRVEDVSLHTLTWTEMWDGSGFYVRTDACLWYVSALEDGEALDVLTWIPDVTPRLSVTWTDADGHVQTRYISESGRDGSLILMEEEHNGTLPREISGSLPFSYDIDGDGEKETLTMDSYSPGEGITRRRLLVDGKPAVGEAESPSDAPGELWIADVNWDGTAELFYSFDAGSDDYLTIGWHGDTLEPMAFTGDSRYGADPGEWHSALEGRLLFSAYAPVVDGWIYQLGTYAAVRPYELREDGVMAPRAYYDWSYRANRQWLTVRRYLPVTMDDVGQAVLTEGETIRLLGSEGGTIRFITSGGQRGVLRAEVRREEDGSFAGWFIDGLPEDDYFEFLPYAG